MITRRYLLTPEFHRNLWLKFSLFRVVAAPLFIGICMVICLNIIPDTKPGDGNMATMLANQLFDKNYSYSLLTTGAMWLYFIVVCVWGNYEAGAAMQEEIKGNTWDFQRMSSITALQLVAGKIFGATSYVWYIGFITLVPYYYGLSHLDIPAPAYNQVAGGGGVVWEPDNDFYSVLYLLFAGLMGHSLAFLASFIDMTSFVGKTGKRRLPRGNGAFALGFVASYCIFAMAKSVTPKLAGDDTIFRTYQKTVWYGQAYDSADFTTLSFVFFCGWFLVGSWRIARAELMHRTMPVVWMGFVGAVLLYALGFTNPTTAYYFYQLLMVFILSLLICYVVMLFEASDGRKYARLADYLKKGSWREVFENTPKWAVTVPFVLAMAAVTLSNMPATGKYITFTSMGAFLLSLMLFALRDGLIVHAMVAGKGARNLGFKVVFYYMMAYVLLPVMHFALMPKNLTNINVNRWIRMFFDGQAGDMQVPDTIRSLCLYYPLPIGDFAVSVLPVLGEALIAAYFLWWTVGRARRQRAGRG